MVQSSIDFLLNNNVTIIQVIFAVIFLLVVFVIFRSFKEEKSNGTIAQPSSIASRRQELREEAAAAEKKPNESVELPKEESPLDDLDNFDDLMAADDKELGQEQIDQALTAAADDTEKPQDTPAPPSVESGELAKALEEKEKLIADLKSEVATLQEKLTAAPPPVNPELESKVKELSEKLAEYEIIEDDIANLSFYKNENAKLKNELDQLRSANSQDLEAVVEQEKAEEIPPEVMPDVSTKKEATNTETPAEPKKAEEPQETQESKKSVLDEFEQAVKQKEALEKGGDAPEVETAPIAVNDDANLLKEFENVVEKELAEEASAPSPAPILDSAEAPKEEAPSETKPAPQEAEAVKPQDIDPSKLVAEAEALAESEPPPVEKDDGKDSNQKLIEEFENFVNKS